MSGLHEAFDEVVVDVPVYGDLDRAIEQVDHDRRHRYGAVVGLAAAAAVLAVVAGIVAVSRDSDTAPPVTPTPTPVSPSPTPAKTQSPRTWADTAITSTFKGKDWDVPDPLLKVRDAWFPVVAEHLDPKADHLESGPGGVTFQLPAKGSTFNTDVPGESRYQTFGRIGLMVDRGGPNPLDDDSCGYTSYGHRGALGEGESCSTKRFAGPGGERARISSWGRRCTSWEGGGPAPATCGDYAVTVAVQRPDGLIGYVVVEGRGTPDFNPFSQAAMTAAAADPRLALPATAYAVPSDDDLAAVVEDHFPRYEVDDQGRRSAADRPGQAWTTGRLGRLGLSVQVWPTGGRPACGRSWLIECVERRVYGADDPTTVFVGAWDEEDWADCCPRNSRADARGFVYVGPRHTVVATELLVVRADEDPISAALDQRLIDLLLDPRLQ